MPSGNGQRCHPRDVLGGQLYQRGVQCGLSPRRLRRSAWTTPRRAGTISTGQGKSSGTVVFNPAIPNETVTVISARRRWDGRFFLNLSNPVNATIGGAQGTWHVVWRTRARPTRCRFSRRGCFSAGEHDGLERTLFFNVTTGRDQRALIVVNYFTTTACRWRPGRISGRANASCYSVRV